MEIKSKEIMDFFLETHPLTYYEVYRGIEIAKVLDISTIELIYIFNDYVEDNGWNSLLYVLYVHVIDKIMERNDLDTIKIGVKLDVVDYAKYYILDNKEDTIKFLLTLKEDKWTKFLINEIEMKL